MGNCSCHNNAGILTSGVKRLVTGDVMKAELNTLIQLVGGDPGSDNGHWWRAFHCRYKATSCAHWLSHPDCTTILYRRLATSFLLAHLGGEAWKQVSYMYVRINY